MSNSTYRKYSLFPKTLEQCIEPLTRPVLKKQGLAGSRILTHWASIVGSNLASHTYPEKLSFPQGKKSGGTLTISTESGFATELQHMQPIIIEKLASYFGYYAISRIVISHTWTPVDAPKKNTPLPQPLASDSIDYTNQIDDKDLREALKSLAKTLSKEPT